MKEALGLGSGLWLVAGKRGGRRENGPLA